MPGSPGSSISGCEGSRLCSGAEASWCYKVYLKGAIKCVQSRGAESDPPGVAGREKHPLRSSQMCWEGTKVLGRLGPFFLDPGKSARQGQGLWGQARIRGIRIWTSRHQRFSFIPLCAPDCCGWLLVAWLIPNYVIGCIAS